MDNTANEGGDQSWYFIVHISSVAAPRDSAEPRPPAQIMADAATPSSTAPAATDEAASGPVGLEFKVCDYSHWQYRVEQEKRDTPAAKRIKDAASAIEVPSPPGYKFNTVRYLFKWDKHDGYWTLKDFSTHGVEGNIISVEEFLETKAIKDLIEDMHVCDSIVYYDAIGNEIDEQTAFEWSKNMHPSKKPPSKRPGKRVLDPERDTSAPPATSTAPATPATSKSRKA